MKKTVLLLIAVILYSATITSTKKALKNTSYNIAKMNKKLDSLAKEILAKQKYINRLSKLENSVNNDILSLQKALKNSNKALQELNDLSSGLIRQRESIKNEIIKFISQNYYLDTKETDSLNDLIYSELNKKALKLYSAKVAALLENLKKINKTLNQTNQKIVTIKQKKQLLQNKKNKLKQLKTQKIKELLSLKKQKDLYKSRLLSMIKKQQSLRQKLQELKIIKKRRQAHVNVKKVGSAYFKPKTANYRGRKTIPPVYGKVIKKFGSYIDPIYKIRIYNDSITIKAKPNSLVRSIMKGKVVYIGNNGDKKVIFIKHSGNLFSIYANLSKISPLLKKGSYVRKGQVIARINNTLEFEITYKDRPINPLKVIYLK
jgi:murein DD-endopeptidase MepM/ murein hydrolase activator NlpD